MSCKCQECGKDYKVDIIVDDELWKKISPKKSDSGMLCGRCIVDKVEKLNEYNAFSVKEIANNCKNEKITKAERDEFAIGFADWVSKLMPSQRVSVWSKNGEFKGLFDMDNERLLSKYIKEKESQN